MSTTTVRLPEELKARIDKLAAAAGLSSHAFMVDALAQTAEQFERQQAFEAQAERRWRQYRRSGESISHDDLLAYARGLAGGKKPAQPVPRKALPKSKPAKRA
jgi:predicted transcriptional regulator